MQEAIGIKGELTWVLTDKDGHRISGGSGNLVTQIGDEMYGERGAGVTSPPALPTGMKLGSGSTAVAKSGTGSALTTYLSNSHQALDATYPQSALVSGSRKITYQCTFAAGKATTAGAITEAVLVNETLADATSASAATVARALLSGLPSKDSSSSLVITWNHSLAGS